MIITILNHEHFSHGTSTFNRNNVGSDNVLLSHDGIMREEFAEDEPFIGPKNEQPWPSFQVTRDVYKGYMLLIRPGDEIHQKPVWVALALSDPVLTFSSEYF
jgi:hypothetical protein